MLLKKRGRRVSNLSIPGCHWSLLYVDTISNKWYYIDTLGWATPKDLADTVNPILDAFSLKKLPAQGRFVAHKSNPRSATAIHHCVSSCLPNIPLQTCSSVCGVIVVVMAAICSMSPTLWRSDFLSRTCNLPTCVVQSSGSYIHQHMLVIYEECLFTGLQGDMLI